MNTKNKSAILVAIVANFSITIGKLIVALFTGSAALLAETFHSLGDTVNQIMIYVGYKRSKRRRTKIHPMGYGRERYFYALIISLSIFSLGGLFALYQGFISVKDPRAVEHLKIAIFLLLFSAFFESISFITAIKAAKGERGSNGWWGYIKNSKAPEIPLLLLEDLGALLGILIALAGLILTGLTGNAIFDSLASILIGMLLVTIAILLFLEFKSLLIGEAASKEMYDKIKNFLKEEGHKKFKFKTLQTGPDEVIVIVTLNNFNRNELVKLKKALKGLDKEISDVLFDV